MKGRRIPSDGRDPIALLEEPGDYCGPIIGADGKNTVWFLLPCARDEDVEAGLRSVLRVCSPPHVFRECTDGSLEIRESIGVYTRAGERFAWHGYLDEGHEWRTA